MNRIQQLYILIVTLFICTYGFGKPVEIRLPNGLYWSGSTDSLVRVTTLNGFTVGTIEQVDGYNLKLRDRVGKLFLIDKGDILDISLFSNPQPVSDPVGQNDSNSSNRKGGGATGEVVEETTDKIKYESIIADISVKAKVLFPIEDNTPFRKYGNNANGLLNCSDEWEIDPLVHLNSNLSSAVVSWNIEAVKTKYKDEWIRTPTAFLKKNIAGENLAAIQIKWFVQRSGFSAMIEVGDETKPIPFISLVASKKVKYNQSSFGGPFTVSTNIDNRKTISCITTLELKGQDINGIYYGVQSNPSDAGLGVQPNSSIARNWHSATSFTEMQREKQPSDAGVFDEIIHKPGQRIRGGSSEKDPDPDGEHSSLALAQRGLWPIYLEDRLLKKVWNNALPVLTEKALRPINIVMVFDNDNFVRTRFSLRNKQLQLQHVSSESLDLSTLFDEYLIKAVYDSIAGVTNFQQYLARIANAKPAEAFESGGWSNFNILSQHNKEVPMRCIHESLRPQVYKERGQSHPLVCSGCRDGTDKHYITRAEAQLMKGKMEALISHASTMTTGGVIETSFPTIPCENHTSRTKTVTVREWNMDGTVRFNETDTMFGKCVKVELINHPEWVVNNMVLNAVGQLVVSFSITGWEQVGQESAINNPDTPAGRVLGVTGEVIPTPKEVLKSAMFTFEHSDGGFLFYKYNPTQNLIEPTQLTYKMWKTF